MSKPQAAPVLPAGWSLSETRRVAGTPYPLHVFRGTIMGRDACAGMFGDPNAAFTVDEVCRAVADLEWQECADRAAMVRFGTNLAAV